MHRTNVSIFNSSKAPPNYVPGVGRGANGFTTRSDIGPGQFGTGGDDGGGGGDKDDSTATLFQGMSYDKEDDEADKRYEEVDERMASRHRRKRTREEMESDMNSADKIRVKFADLKAGLGQCTNDDWASIPEIGDRGIKKKQQDIWTPVPDDLIASRGGPGTGTSVNANEQSYGGAATPENMTPVTDQRAMGTARGMVLDLKLAQQEDSVTGQTVVDPKGYITDLDRRLAKASSEVEDTQRIRALMKAVTNTDPTYAPGWVAYARMEERVGRLAAARKLIGDGCKACPHSEDVWLEALRLQNPVNARQVIAQALQKLPTSVKLWLQAVELEKEGEKKKNILRRALLELPQSVRLWKELIDLETPDRARILLGQAVQRVNNVSLWLALAKLESYDNAKKVLNEARKKNPTEAKIWVAGAQLEEQRGNESQMDVIIKKAASSLSAATARDQWLELAAEAEKSEHPKTCRAIVQYSADCYLSSDGEVLELCELVQKWLGEAAQAAKDGNIVTARSCYEIINTRCPSDEELWMKAALFERTCGTKDTLDEHLRSAVRRCPQATGLWLMAAREKWMSGDVHGARDVINEAVSANPECEAIYLEAVRMESSRGEVDRARELLTRVREKNPTARLWLKAAKLERWAGAHDEELALLKEGVKRFGEERGQPSRHTGLDAYAKLWLMYLQCEVRNSSEKLKASKLTGKEAKRERERLAEGLRKLYQRACQSCPTHPHIWVESAQVEEQFAKDIARARSVLGNARSQLGQNAHLQCFNARMEHRSGDPKTCVNLISEALKAFPESGYVWSTAIELEAPAKKRAQATQAVRRVQSSAAVVTAVAGVFWSERDAAKTRKWLERAVKLDPDYGDAWAFWYSIEKDNPEEQARLVAQCQEAEPTHGPVWNSIAKDATHCGPCSCALEIKDLIVAVAKKF